MGRDVGPLREPQLGEVARGAAVRHGLTAPEPAQHVGGVAQRRERRRGRAVLTPPPRRGPSEPETEPPSGERLERLTHRGQHHGVPQPGMGDRGADVDALGDLADRAGERRQVLGVVPLADPHRAQPELLGGVCLLEPRGGSVTPPGST